MPAPRVVRISCFALAILLQFCDGALVRAGEPVSKASIEEPETARPVPTLPGAAVKTPPKWRAQVGKSGVPLLSTAKDQTGIKFLEIPDAKRGLLTLEPISLANGPGFYALHIEAKGSPGTRLFWMLRALPPAFKNVWQDRTDLSGAWKTYDYFFQIDKLEAPLSLGLFTSGPGQVELRSFSLEKLKEDEVAKSLHARYANEAPDNLLRVSRFPLGLPPGWTLTQPDRHAPVQPVQEPPEPDSSAHQALHIAGKDTIRLSTESFEAKEAMEPHTLSLDVRGTGSWTARVLSGREGKPAALGEASFNPDGTWRRIVIPFQPRLNEPYAVIQIEGRGELWLDKLRAAATSKGTDYVSAKPNEVALVCVSASPHRFQFADEPAQAVYRVLGPTDGADLKIKVIAASGESRELPPIPLGGQADRGTFD